MTDILPTLSILASALKLEHLADSSMLRAADNALSHVAALPAYEFDGSELRIVSQSEAAQGAWVITDGVTCTCKGGRHPMCKHRALYRLLLAREVLLDPLYLKTKIIEQIAPAAYLDDTGDAGDCFALNLPDDDAPAAKGWADRAAQLRQIHADADDWYRA